MDENPLGGRLISEAGSRRRREKESLGGAPCLRNGCATALQGWLGSVAVGRSDISEHSRSWRSRGRRGQRASAPMSLAPCRDETGKGERGANERARTRDATIKRPDGHDPRLTIWSSAANEVSPLQRRVRRGLNITAATSNLPEAPEGMVCDGNEPVSRGAKAESVSSCLVRLSNVARGSGWTRTAPRGRLISGGRISAKTRGGIPGRRSVFTELMRDRVARCWLGSVAVGGRDISEHSRSWRSRGRRGERPSAPMSLAPCRDETGKGERGANERARTRDATIERPNEHDPRLTKWSSAASVASPLQRRVRLRRSSGLLWETRWAKRCVDDERQDQRAGTAPVPWRGGSR